MLTASLLLALTLAPADAPSPPPDAAVSDAGELQGEWEIESVFISKKDETRLYQGDRWVFVGSSHWIIEATGQATRPTTVRVDAGRGPSEVEVAYQGGKNDRGIYHRIGDELLWAEGGAAGRPSAFELAEGVIVWRFRRLRK
jgi:uncharacterized protein (TIGR03067 family)